MGTLENQAPTNFVKTQKQNSEILNTVEQRRGLIHL